MSALYDEKVHHIIVNGCSNQAKERVLPLQQHVCKDRKILFAWALKADPLVLPDGAAIPVGGHSDVNTIQIECHYKDKFDGSDNITGVKFHVTDTVPERLVGIFLVGAYSIYLPPKEWTNINVGCPYRWEDPIEVFAFRTHAHTNGKVITGYRNGLRQLIIKIDQD